MKIGLVNEYFPPFAPGGAEWSNLALARALAEKHDVVVITPNYGTVTNETIDGVRVFRFHSPFQLSSEQLTVPQRYLTSLGFGRQMARAVRETAVSHQLDIIHSQNKYSLLGSWWGSRNLSIPFVQSVRDTSFICPTGQCFIEFDPQQSQCRHFSYWWRVCLPLFLERYILFSNHRRVRLALLRRQVYLRLQQIVLKKVDGVVGVSNGILDVHHNSGIHLGKQTTAIYNIPPSSTTPSQKQLANIRQKYKLQNKQLVLYAGKLSPGKGSQLLADAAKLVFESFTNVQFLFAGQGDIELPGKYARHLGRIPHSDLQSLYHLANIIVIPSSTPEAFSRVGLEAMAAGKPLIGTAVGGTPEQIENGRNGLLVPRKNANALAQAILNLLNHPHMQQAMGKVSLDYINTRFNAQTSITKLENFYQQLIENKTNEPNR